MGTIGLVSVRRNGNVVMKLVAGMDGQTAKNVANRICEMGIDDIDAVYAMAIEESFGHTGTLVVYTANDFRADAEECCESFEALGSLYHDNLLDPYFCPRWECGLSDHKVVVDLFTHV